MKNISMKNVVMGSVLAIAAVSSLTANAATICSGGIATDGPQVAVGTFVKIAFTPKCSANVNLNGTDSLVWRHEEGDFAGGKYYSGELELLGGRGFNKDRTYEVKAVQVSAKGKDLTLASGKVKLIKSGKKPEKTEEDDADKVPEDQDAHDSLA